MTEMAQTIAIPRPAKPEPDPIPWLTETWQSSGCFATDLPGLSVNDLRNAQTDPFGIIAATLTATLNTVASTVSALHNDSDPYRVKYADDANAGTSFETRTVHLGLKVLRDKSLTEGQRAAIITGLALHEVGHIRHTKPAWAAVQRIYAGTADFDASQRVCNVADDVRTEGYSRVEFPSLGTALDAMAWYMLADQEQAAAKAGIKLPVRPNLTTLQGRERTWLAAARWPWLVDWTDSMDILSMVREWADRCLSAKPKGIADLVTEALAWINDLPKAEMPDEDGEPGDEPDEPTEGDDDEPVLPGEGEGEGEGEGDDDGGNEPTDDDGEAEDGESEGEGEGEGEGDESESESESTEGGSATDTGEYPDSDGGDTEGEGEGESDGDVGAATEGEGGKSAAGTEGELAEGESASEGTEGGTGAAGNSGAPSDPDAVAEDLDPDVGDLEVPDCASHGLTAPDVEANIAQAVAVSHQESRRKFARIRRYRGENGSEVLVRERRVARKGRAVRLAALDYTAPDEAEQAALDRSGEIADEAKQLRKYTASVHMTSENPQAAQALRAVMSSARRGPGAPERLCRTGKVDRSRLARAAQGDGRVFVRRTAAAPQRVRAHILVDCSGSMWDHTGNISRAAQAARNIAHALDLIPWATGAVYGHTTDGMGAYVVPVWQSGEKRDQMDDLVRIMPSGNEDGYAIAYVADDLLEVKRPDERGVVVVISDGYPAYNNGIGHVQSVTDHYRRKGLRVVAVSIAAGVAGPQFAAMYAGDVVEYDPNPSVFARNLARVIGSSI